MTAAAADDDDDDAGSINEWCWLDRRFLKWDDAPCDLNSIGGIKAVCEVELPTERTTSTSSHWHNVHFLKQLNNNDTELEIFLSLSF